MVLQGMEVAVKEISHDAILDLTSRSFLIKMKQVGYFLLFINITVILCFTQCCVSVCAYVLYARKSLKWEGAIDILFG